MRTVAMGFRPGRAPAGSLMPLEGIRREVGGPLWVGSGNRPADVWLADEGRVDRVDFVDRVDKRDEL